MADIARAGRTARVTGEQSFCFEAFTLDLRRGSLRAGDREIDLRPKSFALLCYLVENAGRLVSKDELITAVWPDVVVTDESLTRCVSDVRLALQDQAQRIIKTVPRRGYLLAAPVSQAAMAPEPVQIPAAAPGVAPASQSLAEAGAAPRAAEPSERGQSSGAHAEPRAAERRQLTALACELIGLAALSTRLDPEDLHELTVACHRRCTEIIERHRGQVAHCSGDGVLAYFGYAQTHEYDAERAVHAGLALVESLPKLPTVAGIPLAARVGIATGLVVVGDLAATGTATEPGVVGGTPNLAARLQALAEPGAVVISAGTRALTGGLFEYRDLGAVAPTGFAEAVPAWQVLGASAAESRFEALRATTTTLIGRGEEIELLLRRWEQAKEGEGSVVLLSGEPGIGKSRIAQTILERLSGEPHTRLRYFCSPHHQDSALYPIVTQLERAAGFRREDTDGQRLDKLEAVLAPATDDLGVVVPLLADLLSLPTGARYPVLDLSPQKRKEKTLHALVATVEGLAARRPVLVVFEDVHWSDPTTLEMLDLLVDRVAALRVLLIITFRPEFTPSWVGRPTVTLLSLSRLSPRQRAEMITQLTGGKLLPKEIADQIIDRTDGVPLFIEELTKAVIESGQLVASGDRYVATGPAAPLAIPTSLQESLLARLDRLAPTRFVAQIAAALGRHFSHELISAVAAMPQEQLDDALTQLVDAELIFRRGTPPDAEYTFKHALVQDTAYNTLLLSRRKELHAAIARVLKKQFPETAESQPELLAHHFTEAGLGASAVDWWQRAGARAIARSANVEAVRHLTRALAVLAMQPESVERDRREFDLRFQLRPPLYLTTGFASSEMAANFARITLLGERLGESERTWLLLYWSGLRMMAQSQLTAFLTQMQRFMSLAARASDTNALTAGHQATSYVLFMRGELPAARGHSEQAIELYDPRYEEAHIADYNFVPGPWKTCLLSLIMQQLGYLDQAAAMRDAAMAAAKDSGHGSTIAWVSFHAALFSMIADDAPRAERDATRFREFIQQKELPYWRWHCETLLGWAQAKRGSVEAGLAGMRQAELARQKVQTNLWVPFYLIREAEILSEHGQHDQALSVLGRASTLIDEMEQRCGEAELHRVRAVALSATGSAENEVESSFDRALEVAQAQGAKLWQLRAAASRARLWSAAGRRRDARRLLEPIYGWFTEGFDTVDLVRAKTLLDSVS